MSRDPVEDARQNVPGLEHYETVKKLLTEASQIPAHHDDTNPEADRTLAEAQIHTGLAIYEALTDIAQELGIVRRQHQGY